MLLRFLPRIELMLCKHSRKVRLYFSNNGWGLFWVFFLHMRIKTYFCIAQNTVGENNHPLPWASQDTCSQQCFQRVLSLIWESFRQQLVPWTNAFGKLSLNKDKEVLWLQDFSGNFGVQLWSMTLQEGMQHAKFPQFTDHPLFPVYSGTWSSWEI